MTPLKNDLKKKYGAEWALVTGASSGLSLFPTHPISAPCLCPLSLPPVSAPPSNRDMAHSFRALAPCTFQRGRGHRVRALTPPHHHPVCVCCAGIGKAIVEKLCGQGINVVLVALDDKLLAATFVRALWWRCSCALHHCDAPRQLFSSALHDRCPHPPLIGVTSTSHARMPSPRPRCRKGSRSSSSGSWAAISRRARTLRRSRRVRQLRHHFGPFLALFSAPHHPARPVCYALLGAHAYRVLISAWNPML